MAEQGPERGWRLEWWVPAIYALLSGVWIYGSDTLVAAIAGSMERQRAFSVYKGFGFVFVTAVLLHLGLRWALRRERAGARRAREAHRFNQQIIQSAQEGVIVYGPDLRYQVWNPFMEQLTGFPAHEVLGKHPLEVYPPLLEAGVIDRLERVLAGEKVDPLDFPYHIPATGKSGWTTDTSAPLRNDKGEIIGVIGMVSDISERKRAEEALRESNELLSLYIRNSPIYTYIKEVTATESRVLQASENFQQMIGIPGSEMVGRTMTELFPADLAKKITADDWTIVSEGRVLELAEELNGRSSTTIKFPIVQGGKTLLAGFTIDVTERKQIEDSLEESREKYRGLSEGAYEAIIISEQGRVLEQNRRAEEMFGYSNEEAVGRPGTDWVVPEDREQVMKNMLAGIETPYEATGLRKDGSRFPAIIRGRMMHFKGRTVRVTSMRDMTERRQAEEERRRLQAQLQQAQKMESLGSLAGGVAHDMNNVLGAILGMAELGLETPIYNPAYFETISKAAVRGGKMVKSLLSFARQSPAENRDLDANAILREVVRLLERTTLSKVRLEMRLAEDLQPIRGDANALTHAFLNVCLNAVDAMPEQGTLSLQTRNVDDDWIEVMVEDTGSGMPREVLERALDPFFTTKEQGKGTGLGLSMVYSTVTAHQGQLEIQSEPGQGTRVGMRFPACEPAATPAELADESRPSHAQGQLNVLLVDDDELFQGTQQAILNALGHRVTAAFSGEEALTEIEAGLQPDVVILDMNMPGLGGSGTLPRLRKLCPAVPVLLATGRADQAALNLVHAHPGVTLLSKPFAMKELVKHLEAIGRA